MDRDLDCEVWEMVMQAVCLAAREVGYRGRKRLYPVWLIVAMYIWCCWHDRPLYWACSRRNYCSMFRPRRLPSRSQFGRRLKEPDVQRVLALVHDRLAERGVLTAEGYLDGKSLLVSSVSKDPDARRGKIARGFGKGYKLHAFVNARRRIVVWSTTSLAFDEKIAAQTLVPHLPPMTENALIGADTNYDSASLHKDLACGSNAKLISPLKGQDRVGDAGHHPVTLRQMGEDRRALVKAWEETPDLVEYCLRARNTIESCFGVLTCTAGGLGTALPPWVRRIERVRRWVGVKIILYNARLKARENRNLAAAA